MTISISGLPRRADKKTKGNYPSTEEEKTEFAKLVMKKIESDMLPRDAVNEAITEKNANIASITFTESEEIADTWEYCLENWDDICEPYKMPTFVFVIIMITIFSIIFGCMIYLIIQIIILIPEIISSLKSIAESAP